MSQFGNTDNPPPYGEQPAPYDQPPAYENQAYPPAPPAQPSGYPQPRQNNGMAIASLVCGIAGLFLFGVVLGPLAVIFGALGLSRANRGASGRGMAIAGLVLGLIATVVAVILLVAMANHRFVV
jgi:hypothetical protein